MTEANVEITVNGRRLRVRPGITAASALLNAGVSIFRRSRAGAARGPLCGMGVCYECRVTIDGVPHRRACMAIVVPGMIIEAETVP
jgi:predicted molibdopterin-dependent oxidoreductase YjgC